jgi:hypothetical protein
MKLSPLRLRCPFGLDHPDAKGITSCQSFSYPEYDSGSATQQPLFHRGTASPLQNLLPSGSHLPPGGLLASSISHTAQTVSPLPTHRTQPPSAQASGKVVFMHHGSSSLPCQPLRWVTGRPFWETPCVESDLHFPSLKSPAHQPSLPLGWTHHFKRRPHGSDGLPPSNNADTTTVCPGK